MLKIGFMSCIHGSYRNVRKLIKKYNSFVDVLVVNGDLGDDFKEMKPLAKEFSGFKKRIILMPGSHETKKDFYKFCKLLKKNVVVLTKPKKIMINNQELVFLPGSDWMSTDKGFQITKKTLKSDLSKLLSKNSILISHVPPKMKGNSIDLAHFGECMKNVLITEKKKSRVIVKDVLPKGSRSPLDRALFLKSQGLPIKIKKENVGNKDLANLIKKKGVRKFVCGHIHESGGKATNTKSRSVKQNKWSEELFYNVGSVKEGRAGIIFLEANKVKYNNVKI